MTSTIPADDLQQQWGNVDPAREQIRSEFVRRRGYWASDWQLILELAPEVMAAYTELSAYAGERGTLDPVTREFLYIATTAAVHHIHPIGIETHGRNALAAGATPEQLVTVLALVAGLGVAAHVLALDVLRDVAPDALDLGAQDARVQTIKDRYVEVFGIWDDGLETAVRADPGYFAVYVEWAAAARVTSRLDARQVALISIVANASVTHLDRVTLTREVRSALAHGVHAAEIAQACQLVSGVSVHSLTVGVPIIAELARAHGQEV